METVLHNFTGPDGSNPLSNLIVDAKGNFYGTAWYGGIAGLRGQRRCRLRGGIQAKRGKRQSCTASLEAQTAHFPRPGWS